MLQCRNLAAELGLTSIEAYKMDATAAVQSFSQAGKAALESGNAVCASFAMLDISSISP